MNNLLKYEQHLMANGIKYIAGVDEVGRGALAGPMVIGAVILKRDDLLGLLKELTNNDVVSEENKILTQITDSKLLSDKKRRALSKYITTVAISYSIVILNNKTIDKKGIAVCTNDGFYKAIQRLTRKPEHILTDAFSIQNINKSFQTNIKHGDRLSITIAAASIIAKVYRDDLMIKLHNTHDEYKLYQFDQNKAYGTEKHIEAIYRHGPSNIHRTSFEPVKSLLRTGNMKN